MKYVVSLFLILAFFTSSAGCTDPVDPPADAGETVNEVDLSNEKIEQTLTSSDGKYTIDISTTEKVPRNEHFSLKVVLKNKEGNIPDNVELRFDAAMISHKHGMNVKPTIEKMKDHYIIKGVLFHMIGDWTLFFKVLAKGEKLPDKEFYKYCEETKDACMSYKLPIQ